MDVDESGNGNCAVQVNENHGFIHSFTFILSFSFIHSFNKDICLIVLMVVLLYGIQKMCLCSSLLKNI